MGLGIKPNNKPTADIPPVIGSEPAVVPAKEEEVVLGDPDERLAQKKYVNDTFHNRVSVNVNRFPQVVSDLKGFAEGSPIKVTYYKDHYSETDVKGRNATEESLHTAHKSVLKIIDFEMRLSGALQYTHDVDENISKIEGEAFTYPGFEPEQGDKLVYEIDFGKYGLFKIIAPPVRTSIRASTYYKIQFHFIDYVTEELAAKLDEGVMDVAYFDKKRFLSEPGALLIHDEVVEMMFLEKQRAKMIHYYQQKFLDEKIMYSFMRPDGIYDPYVTDFMMKIVEFSDLGTMATQLYQDAPYLEDSIWRAFLDPNVPLESVPTGMVKVLYTLGSKSVLVNSLINKKYVKFVDSKSLKDYLDELASSGSEGGTEGEIPADPSIPDQCNCPCCDEIDGYIGDLLLHIHPHYTECPLVGDEDEDGSSGGGTGDCLEYILGDGDQLHLIANFLLYRKIVDLKRLHALIEAVWKMPKLKQYYLLPILIFLSQTVISYIRHESALFEPSL